MKLLIGARYLLKGARILLHPKLRAFVLLPLLVNVIMFAIGFGVLLFFVSGWMEGILGWLPGWMSGVTTILWFLFISIFGMGVFFSFNMLANFIAAPLNGILSEKVEQVLSGHPVAPTNLGAILSSLPHSILREARKLMYYLPRMLLLVVVSFIPVVNVLAPWLWLAFGAWVMAIHYIDYPMDNNGVTFKNMKASITQERLLHLGFGGAVSMLLMVPFANFFAMPLAVAGATILYVEQHDTLVKTSPSAPQSLPIVDH